MTRVLIEAPTEQHVWLLARMWQVKASSCLYFPKFGTEPTTLRTWVNFLVTISVNTHLVLNSGCKAGYKLGKLQNWIFLLRIVSRSHDSGYNPMHYISILASIWFNKHVELPCNPLIHLIGQTWYTEFKNVASGHNHVYSRNTVICTLQFQLVEFSIIVSGYFNVFHF